MSGELSSWCERHLGSPIVETLFASGNLSAVAGVRLADGRDIVLKTRPAHPRLAGCEAVHEYLWRQGFPCPMRLAGPVLTGDQAISAELMLPGGEEGGSAAGFAELLARFIELAPPVSEVPDLDPAPAWMHWYHSFPGVWPPPDDRPDDLNDHPETAWLDDIGTRVRARLAHLRDSPKVIGHCDWETHNLRWKDGQPWAVHDWDSVVAEPETVIVGVAAAMWPASATCAGASVAQTEEFLLAYQAFRGSPFSPEQVRETWAAGMWVRSFNAKKFLLDGFETLTGPEAAERMHRAGA
jgi:hypothetical protein